MAENRYGVLSKAYMNPTKLSIILLLTEESRMTVTQMSEYINVSRSNLYHFVSQLVDDHILNEPEVVPKKNYVEKYYSLNEGMFRKEDPEEWDKLLKGASLDDLRELFSSLLMGYSLILNLAAKRISSSSDEEAEELRSWLAEETAWTASYSVIGQKTTGRVRPILKELNNELSEEKSSEEDPGEDNLSRLLLVFLPMIGRKRI